MVKIVRAVAGVALVACLGAGAALADSLPVDGAPSVATQEARKAIPRKVRAPRTRLHQTQACVTDLECELRHGGPAGLGRPEPGEGEPRLMLLVWTGGMPPVVIVRRT